MKETKLMNLCVKQISDKYNITKYYRVSNVKDEFSAIEYLCNIKNTQGLTVNYIELSTPTKDQDNTGTIELWPDVDYKTLLERYKTQKIDIIQLSGKYNEKPIKIGINLYMENLFFITIERENLADIEGIERELSLNVKNGKR